MFKLSNDKSDTEMNITKYLKRLSSLKFSEFDPRTAILIQIKTFDRKTKKNSLAKYCRKVTSPQFYVIQNYWANRRSSLNIKIDTAQKMKFSVKDFFDTVLTIIFRKLFSGSII